MKLVRYQTASGPSYGVLKSDGTVNRMLGNPFGDNSVAARAGDISSLKLLPPVTPGKIVAIGLNYGAHAKEAGQPVPTFPLLFFKPPTAVIGHGQDIVLPKISDHVEHECELAVVIGKTARHVTEEEALDYVFGYACANDVSARDWQKRETQWVRAKGFDTFFPLGPCIVTGLDPSDLDISTRVNGSTRQHSNTSDLIFSVPYLIADISKVMTLFPGDVISTGTPAGVGRIEAGDTVQVEIAQIGILSNTVVAEQ